MGSLTAWKRGRRSAIRIWRKFFIISMKDYFLRKEDPEDPIKASDPRLVMETLLDPTNSQ